MGMRPCHFREGNGNQQILGEEQLQLIADNRKELELVMSGRFVWILLDVKRERWGKKRGGGEATESKIWI